MIIVLVPKPINPKPAIMKKLLCLCICFCLLATTKAQFEKGQKVITGQLSFNNWTTQSQPAILTSSLSQIATSFSLSRFTSPTIIKGFGFNFAYALNNSEFNDISTGIFYNCTKLEKIASRFYLTFAGNAALNYYENQSDFTKNSGIISSVSLSLGLLYHLNNRFLLSASVVDLASLSYGVSDSKSSTNTYNYNTKNKIFDFYTGLSNFDLYKVVFGFKYLLKKK
jgi:hypothetical protein